MGAIPEISVIVIAFNAEGSIERCIDSILAQTLQDFELLVIDDGSTDGTRTVIDHYYNPRIRSFTQQNQGVALTRQRGLDLAKGKYSIFVDADDWIEPAMLEGLHGRAMETDADMVICDFLEEFGSRTEYRKQDPGSENQLSVQWKMLGELQASLWNKLIRHSLYKEYGLRFQEGINCCEDQLLLVRLLSNPLKVAYLEKAYYHYDKSVNTASITNQWHSRPVREWLRLLEAIEPYMQGPEGQKAFDLYAARRIYDSSYSSGKEQADYRLIYSRYRDRLKRSALPLKQKMICHLRYAGLAWMIRLIRKSRA